MNPITEINEVLANELVHLFAQNPKLVHKIHLILNNSDPVKTTEGINVSNESSPAEIDREIRKLEVRYDNDFAIVIKHPGKPSISYDCRHLGFRDNRAKAWKFLTDVLSDPSATFSFGTAYFYPESNGHKRIKNKEYDARWRLCDDLCKKLMGFLQKEFGWNFPKGYKLYEKLAAGPVGERKFKFQIKKPTVEDVDPSFPAEILQDLEEKYSALDEIHLVNTIARLNSDYSLNSTDSNGFMEELVVACRIGQEKFGWSDGQTRKILID